MQLLDENIKTFIWKSLLFFTPFLFAGGALMGLGIYSGELWPITKVIDYEISHPRETLFLKAYIPEDHRLKYYGVLRRNPEVLVIGSSRALTFREEMFNGADFYNAGRLIRSYEDLEDFTELMLPKINPKTIYFGVDWYWLGKFNQYERELGAVPETPDPIYDWRAEIYFFKRFAGLLIKDPALMWRIITAQPDPITGKRAIGLEAFNGNGLRFDGSLQNGTTEKKRRDNPAYVDVIIPPVLEQVKRGISHFKYNNQIDQKRVKILEDFLAKAKERNIQIIGFSAPYSEEVYREFITSPSHKAFFAESLKVIRSEFLKAGFPYFDFHNLNSLGLDNSYMLNGGHMGETATAIALKRMTTDPGLWIYLDRKIDQKSTTPLEIIW